MPELRVDITAFALLAAILLAAYLGRRERIPIIILALLSIVWLNVDHDFEGPLLVTIGTSHGIVLADLIGIAGLGASAWLWLTSRR